MAGWRLAGARSDFRVTRPDPGDDFTARARAHRVPRHGGEEGRALHDAHAHRCIRGRADGGRARLVAEQGDLPEPVAPSERVDEASVSDHLGATGLDDVEPVAAVALLED